MNTAYAFNAYNRSRVTDATPMELVIMLYDGAIDALEKAGAAAETKRITVKLKQVDKALAIIEELSNSLNIEVGGEMALNLSDLYYYMIRELVVANLHNDGEKMRHIARLLRELRESWVEVKGSV